MCRARWCSSSFSVSGQHKNVETILTTPINQAAILAGKSRLWMCGIHRPSTDKQRPKNYPKAALLYYGESLYRDMPLEMFSLTLEIVQGLDGLRRVISFLIAWTRSLCHLFYFNVYVFGQFRQRVCFVIRFVKRLWCWLLWATFFCILKAIHCSSDCHVYKRYAHVCENNIGRTSHEDHLWGVKCQWICSHISKDSYYSVCIYM